MAIVDSRSIMISPYDSTKRQPENCTGLKPVIETPRISKILTFSPEKRSHSGTEGASCAQGRGSPKISKSLAVSKTTLFQASESKQTANEDPRLPSFQEVFGQSRNILPLCPSQPFKNSLRTRTPALSSLKRSFRDFAAGANDANLHVVGGVKRVSCRASHSPRRPHPLDFFSMQTPSKPLFSPTDNDQKSPSSTDFHTQLIPTRSFETPLASKGCILGPFNEPLNQQQQPEVSPAIKGVAVWKEAAKEDKWKRGSLDTTCRTVIEGLTCPRIEAITTDDQGLKYFQAASLADGLGEVRRRVYDVLPVLECLGIVTRYGRRYTYFGMVEMCTTITWLKRCADYAQSWAAGRVDPLDGFNIVLDDESRRRAAGRMIEYLVNNCTKLVEEAKSTATDLVGKENLAGRANHSMDRCIVSPEQLARTSFFVSTSPTQSNKTAQDQKILSNLTVKILLFLHFKGPLDTISIADMLEEVDFDPKLLFDEYSLRVRLIKIPSTKPSNAKASSPYFGAVGRRLYDVISVFSGLGIVCTKRGGGRSKSYKSASKSKRVKVNPVLYAADAILPEHFSSFLCPST